METTQLLLQGASVIKKIEDEFNAGTFDIIILSTNDFKALLTYVFHISMSHYKVENFNSMTIYGTKCIPSPAIKDGEIEIY